jgi:hypothetical protein
VSLIVVKLAATKAILTMTCITKESDFTEEVVNINNNCTNKLVVLENLDFLLENVVAICVSAY